MLGDLHIIYRTMKWRPLALLSAGFKRVYPLRKKVRIKIVQAIKESMIKPKVLILSEILKKSQVIKMAKSIQSKN